MTDMARSRNAILSAPLMVMLRSITLMHTESKTRSWNEGLEATSCC
jgi:hypothetical protein